MIGAIQTKILNNVTLQENGILRNQYGVLIGRLVDDVNFEHADDYDHNIHSNPSAKVWSEFFIQQKLNNNWKIEDIDEGLMLGWFANAMMAMHDYIYQTKKVT